MAESRFHVRFEDGASGEVLGLMLTASPQLGFNRRLINPYCAKAGAGATEDSDLTEWSVVSQRDWRGGRGQDELEDGAAYYDAHNLETRIEGQVTLGPLPQNPSGTLPKYEPGNVEWYRTEWQGAEMQTQGDGAGLSIYTGVSWAQRIMVTSAGEFHAESVEVRIKKTASTTANIRVAIYSDTNPTGVDGLPDTELVYKELTQADVTTSLAWVEFTFTTPYELSKGFYWIVLTSSASGVATGYDWEACHLNPYKWGMCYAGEGRTAWRAVKDYDLTFKVHWASLARSQSFVAPAGGITCTSIQIYISAALSMGTMNVKLCQDDAGAPGTVMTTKAVTPSWTYQWYEVTWDSGQALTGGSTYHIVVEQAAEGSEPPVNNRYFLWGGNSAGGYGTGASYKKIGSGAWALQTEDLYFRVNRDELDGAAVAFARYDDKWYVGAGDTVYEWNEGAATWDVSDAQADDEVTALETWGGYLWAGRGSECVLRRYNGTVWADVAGTYAKLLKAGGGYLHRTDGSAGNEHKLHYTADGTTWSSAIEVGAGDYAVTGLEWYRDMIVCATAVRLWGVSAEEAYPMLSYATQEDVDNGKGLMAWSRTGCLYLPLRFGLYRWNGDVMVAVGPEQGIGLPAERAGKIKALVGTCNWLYIAVDAGTGGYSSVMAYNGSGGWHELQRSEKSNQRIQAIGFETISSPNRVWLGLGNETRYLMLPDYSDNPWQWSGYEFNAQGDLESSWMGGELLEVVKDLHQVVVRGEGITAGQMVEVYYEVDRSGQWSYLGEIVESTREVLEFGASQFVKKVITSGSTKSIIQLASGSTTEDLSTGYWVRINGEVGQVASITDSDTFVLETALESAPASGDIVWSSRPAGREFRLRLVFKTSGYTSTPKVKAVFIRYQNNVLDRFVYSLQVRVADGMKDLGGNAYPHTAADLRVALDAWARRTTPFTLYDPDGVAHTVKVIGVGEGGYVRESGPVPSRYGSVYSMNLVEVA